MEHSLAATLWRLAGLFALVFANGFFVAAEFSIVTVRKTRIDQLIAEGHRGARAVRRAVSAPDRYIAATQLGITMASLGLGWMAEPTLASMIEPAFSFLPAHIAATTAHTIAVAISFSVITFVEMVFGELVPKSIALERSETLAIWTVRPIEIFMRALWPFIRLMHGTAQAIVRALGMKGGDRRAMVHSEEELKMLVTASQEAGVLEENEEQMLHRVFGFADLTAGQVMVPRTELVAIAADSPVDAIVAEFARGRHTRLPVYREEVDDVFGMLHAYFLWWGDILVTYALAGLVIFPFRKRVHAAFSRFFDRTRNNHATDRIRRILTVNQRKVIRRDCKTKLLAQSNQRRHLWAGYAQKRRQLLRRSHKILKLPGYIVPIFGWNITPGTDRLSPCYRSRLRLYAHASSVGEILADLYV